LISWTNPAYQSGDTTNYCREGLMPEDGLAWCELFVHRAPSYAPETLRVDIRGREGTRSQAWIDDRDAHTVVFAELVDEAGNRSCQSNPKVYNAPVGVPENGVLEVETFDLLGRKVVESEARPGVYFRRVYMADGTVVKGRVILR